MKVRFISALLTVLTLTSAMAFAANDDQLGRALVGPQRMAENKARDSVRKPAEVLPFLGIKPEMTVVEVFPGAGWYTEVLAPYLKDKGHLIAVLNDRDPSTQSPGQAKRNQKFTDRFVAHPEVFGKISLGEASDKRIVIADDASVDMILDFRNAHNWVQWGEDAMPQAWFKALKQGGVVGLIDHRQDVGKPYDKESGYIHEQKIVEIMERNGFKLAAKSEALANPKDTKDHPEGVWTLPPVLALGEKDASKYKDIGESDRMLLKFVKP